MPQPMHHVEDGEMTPEAMTFLRDFSAVVDERARPLISAAINEGPCVDVEVIRTLASGVVRHEIELLHTISLDTRGGTT